MNIKIDEKKLNHYVYTIQIRLKYDNNKYIDVPVNSVSKLGFEYDYINNILPILHINFFLTRRETYEVRDNMNNLTVELTVKYTSFKAVTKGSSIILDRYNLKTLFKASYQPFTPDQNYPTKKGDKSSSPFSRDKSIDDPVNSEMMDLYLFNVEDLNSTKTTINNILGSCTIYDGICYILNECNIKKALISSPTNKKMYNLSRGQQLIMPPLNMRNSIDSLQKNYGIYNHGLIQFLDNGLYYLLNKDFSEDVNLPVKNNEYEMVYINIMENDNINNEKEGCYEDSINECYIVNTYDTVHIQDNSDIIKESSGSTFQIMSNKTIINSVSYDESSDRFSFGIPYNEYSTNQDVNTSNTDERVNMYYNNTNSDSIENEILDKRIEESITLSKDFMNIDLSFFTINHKYYINFEDKEKSRYNGIYRLNTLLWAWTVNDFSTVIEFKKIID